MGQHRKADNMKAGSRIPKRGGDHDSSLLSMLIGGLVLVIIGAIVVMTFV